MARRKAVLRLSVRGARRKGYALDRAGRELQRGLIDEMAKLAARSTSIVRDYAPHDQGGLRRGIKASVRSYNGRISVEVESTARSEAGYPYTDVTRFGHRKRVIRPIRGQFLRWQGRRGVVYARQVRGHRPAGDWMVPAQKRVAREVEQAERRLGRRVSNTLR